MPNEGELRGRKVRLAHTLRRTVCLVRHGYRVGANRQMRPVFFDHAHRQDEEGSLTIEGIDLRPRELFELVDSRTGAFALRGCFITRPHAGAADERRGQYEER